MVGRERRLGRCGNDKEASMRLTVVVAPRVVSGTGRATGAVSPLGAQSQIKTPPS
jgi:hypothetical protein